MRKIRGGSVLWWCLFLSVWGQLSGPGVVADAANVANLQERLEKDLEARRPQEFAFIARVVQLVQQDQLPRRIVDAVYLWARQKPRHKFQFFAHGVRRQAARIGVKID